MRIYEVVDNKRDYMDLLFLADEQENMIDKYLDQGTMYVIDDDGVKGECVVTDEGEGVLEIKNIATKPESHGKGYGRALFLDNYDHSIFEEGVQLIDMVYLRKDIPMVLKTQR